MTPEQQENEMLVYTMADVRVMLTAAVDAAMRQEREACAKKVDNWLLAYGGLDKLAAAIRART